MTTTIDLENLRLEHGAHNNRDDGVCLLEAAAWLAGKKHTDHPPCVSPVLGSFGRSFNDCLPDEPRQQLVPFIPRLLDTAGDGQDAARMNVLVRWMVRDYAARWLDLAGLTDEAGRLRELVVPRWPAGAAADDAAAADAAAAAAADAADAAADAAAVAADDAADAAADAAAVAADVAAADVAAADAAAAAADDAAGGVGDLRRLFYTSRTIGYRSARVIALRAVVNIRTYSDARAAANRALAPAVAEFQAAGIQLFDALIDPSAKEEATA